MNFDYAWEALNGDVKAVVSKQKALLAHFDEARELTTRLLRKCADAGYAVVSVGKKHAAVPATESFPFGCSGSVFGYPSARKDHWPAIWTIVAELGIGGGAGNSDQHQVNDNNLIDGVYELRKGKWLRIDKA